MEKPLEKLKISHLLKEYKKGNNSALELLMQGTYKDLYGLAYSYLRDHMLAEDIVSESYMKIIEKIKTVKNEQNLNGYLRTIVINKSLDKLRKCKKELRIEDKVVDYQSDDQQGQSTADSQLVRLILSKLSRTEREALLLWQYGYTLREMSDKTGRTVNQVRLLLDKAKKSFSEKYHKNC